MKKRKLNLTLFLIIICCTLRGVSQTKTFSPKGSFGIDAAVPTRAQNPAFERIMEGLLNGGVDYRYNVYNGLTVGVGLKYSLFLINSFAFNNIAISGGYQIPGAYLRLGYEKFTTDRVSFTGSVRGGYGFLVSFSDSCTVNNGGPNITPAFFVEPQVEMVLLTDKVSEHGFSVVFGYSFYFDEFNQSETCIDHIPSLIPENYEGITRFLSIGFGYHHYLGRDK